MLGHLKIVIERQCNFISRKLQVETDIWTDAKKKEIKNKDSEPGM